MKDTTDTIIDTITTAKSLENLKENIKTFLKNREGKVDITFIILIILIGLIIGFLLLQFSSKGA